jgi:hypothetical protein
LEKDHKPFVDLIEDVLVRSRKQLYQHSEQVVEDVLPRAKLNLMQDIRNHKLINIEAKHWELLWESAPNSYQGMWVKKVLDLSAGPLDTLEDLLASPGNEAPVWWVVCADMLRASLNICRCA